MFVLLLLMHSCGVRCFSSGSGRALEGGDRAIFSDSKGRELNAIGIQVLDRLFRFSVAESSPEIAPALVDAKLPEIAAEDKVRCVVFALLAQGSGDKALQEQCAKEYSFGSYKLLSRLCDDGYIEWLKALPSESASDTEKDAAFATSAANNSARLGLIQSYLQTQMTDECYWSPKQFEERGGIVTSSLDLALYLLYSKAIDQATLGELLGLGSGNPVLRGALAPLIWDTIGTVLEHRVLNYADRSAMKSCMLPYAIENFQQEFAEFFGDWYHAVGMGIYVLGYIRTHEYSEISEQFMAFYVDYVIERHRRPYSALNELFDVYLQQTHGFHTVPTVWNSDPEYFNKVTYLWLRRMFDELCNAPFSHECRDARMKKYMKILSCETFFDILKYRQGGLKSHDLALFMLGYLDEDGRDAYKRYILDESSTNPKASQLVLKWDDFASCLRFSRCEVETVAARLRRWRYRKRTWH
ncbi:hypothetical protein PAPHI01_0146 [Pancytospora philotis]|nr:hypothetical protein PAPHI01_0146 [Pancytospora philotis]